MVNGRHAFAEDKVCALRLRDGSLEACYPVAAVLDIVQMPLVPDMVAMHGMLSGVAVVDGEHLEVINPFALFAALPTEMRRGWELVSPDEPGAPLESALARWPGAEILLTSRYHAAITGVWAGSRVVVIGINEKLRGAAARELAASFDEMFDRAEFRQTADAGAAYRVVSGGAYGDHSRNC